MRFLENVRYYPGFAVGALFTIAAGACMTVFARRIQQYFASVHDRYQPPAYLKFLRFYRRLDSPEHLLDVRLGGMLLFLIGVFCCWVLFAGT